MIILKLKENELLIKFLYIVMQYDYYCIWEYLMPEMITLLYLIVKNFLYIMLVVIFDKTLP